MTSRISHRFREIQTRTLMDSAIQQLPPTLRRLDEEPSNGPSMSKAENS